MAEKRKIRPEVISLWLNIMGFVISFFFYLALLFKRTSPDMPAHNRAQDSLVVIDFRVRTQLQQMKASQDSFFVRLRKHEKILTTQRGEIETSKRKIRLILKSDWDSLSVDKRRDYTEELIKKLKKKKK